MTQQKWPDELTVIRHGLSVRNEAKDKARAEGCKPSWVDMGRDMDTPLTPVGEMQALAAGVELRKRHQPITIRHTRNGGERVGDVDVLYVSPYLRTRQTAARVIEGLGYEPAKVVFDERIREIEFGILDGLTPDGMAAKFPEEIVRRKKEGKYWYRPPGGESRPDVRLRLRSFLDTLIRDCGGLRVCVVTHSVVVLMFRALLERWGEEEYMIVDHEHDVKNASLTIYQNNGHKLELGEYNYVAYPENSHAKIGG